MGESILLSNIVKSFPGVKALDGVSLEIRQGEVHALMGENGAGKSTLMKILAGLYKADGGEIYQDGRKIEIHSIRDSIRYGISMIHQELMPIRDMMVCENIFLGREPLVAKGVRFVDRKRLVQMTKEVFEEVGIDSISPKSYMRELSVAETQLVEIAKAISHNSKYIIMDEPTSAITDKEVAKLFDLIGRLREKGVGIVYISHKMDEIFKIADRITVLRDGKHIATKAAREMDENSLITMMVGRELNLFEKAKSQIGEVVLSVRHLSSSGLFEDINFDLRKGEILGLAGLMGAGRTEMVESIFGLRKLERGEIYLHGKKVRIKNTRDAIKNKIALIPEDRKQIGLNLIASVKDNITIASIDQFTKCGFVNRKKENQIVDEQMKILNIKTPSRNQLVNNLSGGNQQKVVISKWLVSNADIIILDEPTRGIDVGAKSEIHYLISKLAQSGKAVIVISSEMPEVIGMSDRVLVMCEGRITGELTGEETTQERIMSLAMEFKDKTNQVC